MCYYCGCRPIEISENEWKELQESIDRINERLDEIERGILGKAIEKQVEKQTIEAQLRLGILNPIKAIWDEEGYNQWGTKYVIVCKRCKSDLPTGNMYGMSGTCKLCGEVNAK